MFVRAWVGKQFGRAISSGRRRRRISTQKKVAGGVLHSVHGPGQPHTRSSLISLQPWKVAYPEECRLMRKPHISKQAAHFCEYEQIHPSPSPPLVGRIIPRRQSWGRPIKYNPGRRKNLHPVHCCGCWRKANWPLCVDSPSRSGFAWVNGWLSRRRMRGFAFIAWSLACVFAHAEREAEAPHHASLH